MGRCSIMMTSRVRSFAPAPGSFRSRNPPKMRALIGPCREARELHVDTGGGRMNEMPRLLTIARQFARVDARDVAASKQSHGLLHIHGDLDRAGEVVRGAQRNNAENSWCRDDGIRNRAHGSVPAGRDNHRW